MPWSNSITDFRALCAELVHLNEVEVDDWTRKWADAVNRTKAALAQPQPQPQGPTDEELRELRRFHQWPIGEFLLFTISRAVLARWGNR